MVECAVAKYLSLVRSQRTRKYLKFDRCNKQATINSIWDSIKKDYMIEHEQQAASGGGDAALAGGESTCSWIGE